MDPHAVRPLTPEPAARRFDIGRALGNDPDAHADEIDAAVDRGCSHIRLDVPWSRAEPRTGVFDGDVFESLLTAADRAHRSGLKVWCRLLQAEVPRWFDNEGGFGDDRTAARWWPRWVDGVAERLGDHVDGWVPIEAPFGMCTRLAPDDPRRQGDVLHRLVVAWRDAWRLLHGVHPVATSLDVAIERPVDDSPPALAESRRRDAMRWTTWCGSIRDGVVRIPGRADRELDDLDGSCDVLGIALRADRATTDDLDSILQRVHEQRLHRPVAVTLRAHGNGRDERQESIGRCRERLEAAAAELHLVRLTLLD
ncbi:MAG: family 1 glycosylhydrolase [Ilumatobacteraceae bacterium]